MTGKHEPDRVYFCELSHVPSDRGLRFKFDSRPPIALWRVNDEVFATDDTCTHGQASLTLDGYLDENVIECGMHQGCFDIRDGRPLTAPCTVALKTYPVEIADGRVYVMIE